MYDFHEWTQVHNLREFWNTQPSQANLNQFFQGQQKPGQPQQPGQPAPQAGQPQQPGQPAPQAGQPQQPGQPAPQAGAQQGQPSTWQQWKQGKMQQGAGVGVAQQNLAAVATAGKNAMGQQPQG